ncbi:MAG: hypothetical protein LAP40_02385 [Acidobacteriia bacterium]|nr:hypothetical protein [Terriglobia bacterium]
MNRPSPAASALRAFNRYREVIARRGSARVRTGECPVCLGQHEEEIHIATIRVHRWFRAEVTRSFARRPAA